MILRADVLQRVERGEITLAFRRWRRPTVRTGGTLLTPAGQLQIGTVAAIEPHQLSDDEAVRAGFASADELRAELDRRSEGVIYRIELLGLRPDPRVALREQQPDPDAIADLRRRLHRLDAASPIGPWTALTLRLIGEHPGLRAADLCRLAGQQRDGFKVNVRKLKRLGLTESLDVGYRLSPRGRVLLAALETAD